MTTNTAPPACTMNRPKPSTEPNSTISSGVLRNRVPNSSRNVSRSLFAAVTRSRTLKKASRYTAMPANAASVTASDQPLPVVSGPKLSAAARYGIPSVASPSEIAPNARTFEITRVRRTGSVKAEPIRPQNGTSHAA